LKPHRRYSEEENGTLLATVERAQEQSGQPLSWILSELGLTRSVYYDWLDREKEGNLADRSGCTLLWNTCVQSTTIGVTRKRYWLSGRESSRRQPSDERR
jgi:hypothetical protein